MDKMLGNQYFMARKFGQAIPVFEMTLQKDPQDVRTRRKLIICYVANLQLGSALQHMKPFLHLVPRNYFAEATGDENCPCPEILDRWLNEPPVSLSHNEYLMSMGILELFCGRHTWRSHLEEAARLSGDSELIDEICAKV